MSGRHTTHTRTQVESQFTPLPKVHTEGVDWDSPTDVMIRCIPDVDYNPRVSVHTADSAAGLGPGLGSSSGPGSGTSPGSENLGSVQR